MNPQIRGINVAIVITSHSQLGTTGKQTGAWYSEIAIPYYVFKDAGCSVTLASIRGGKAVIDPTSYETQWTTEETRRMDADSAVLRELESTVAVSELRAEYLDIVFMAGGFGTMWDFPSSTDLARLIESCAQSRRQVVATLCHGASALVSPKYSDGSPLVVGRTVTCFTNAEEHALQAQDIVPFLLETRLESLGAQFRGGPEWSDTSHTDGWLVSGQNPASAASTARKSLDVLQSMRRVAA